MRKEWRILIRTIRRADIVLEVVDARDPYNTRDRTLERTVEKMGKKLIIVINKADLVPREVLEEWVKIFRKKYYTVYLSAKERLGTSLLWKVIRRLSDNEKVTVAVAGLPNVGKSSIINILKGSHSVGTSPTPGYTKTSTILRASRWLRVIDTPGVIPKGDQDELVIKSVLRPESLDDPVPPALALIKKLLDKNPDELLRTYKLDKVDDPYHFLECLAKRRGLLLRGGELNIEEAARIVIRDWQRGLIKIFFTPSDYGLDTSSS